MSLLIQYCHIPHYFCFSFISSHCWSTATHPTNMTSHASLCNHSCVMLPFIGPYSSYSIIPAPLSWWTDDLLTSLLLSHFFVTQCALLWPDQSWVVMLCSQGLSSQMSLVLNFLFIIHIYSGGQNHSNVLYFWNESLISLEIKCYKCQINYVIHYDIMSNIGHSHDVMCLYIAVEPCVTKL